MAGDDITLHPDGKMTILAALREKLGEDSLKYVPGTEIESVIDIEAAVEAAKDVDVIVACLGEDTYTEMPGDIHDIEIAQEQIQLIKALAQTGKPIVLVLAQGRPRVIRAIAHDVSAIVYAYLPGLEGGPAIADILSGSEPFRKTAFYLSW